MDSNHTDTHTPASYLTGYGVALGLTIIPFALVWSGWLSTGTTVAVIIVTALIQVCVHLYYFLHINLRTTPKENLLALAFAGILIFLMVGGTLWIMIDLHYQML
jgi:cytochrome o ubiquinol oxidase operon protein cyoD